VFVEAVMFLWPVGLSHVVSPLRMSLPELVLVVYLTACMRLYTLLLDSIFS
jgi:hypothetical protein